MKIQGSTKISELIKANSGSVEAIATLAKPFEKLRNPILRKIMASRVTIAEAAKMGGVALTDFEKVLAPLGFQFEGLETQSSDFPVQDRPQWLQHVSMEDIILYDVRPIIDNGDDPLKEILGQFKKIAAGEILCVVNSFVPTPLIHLLKQEKAEDSFVEKINDKEFHTYFLKKSTKQPVDKSRTDKLLMEDEQSFAEVCGKFAEAKTTVIDVRALEMPGPMEMILTELANLPSDQALYVHHKRVPVYLLEELADKDYQIHIFNKDEKEVKVLIYHK